jgi:hypothetical protein
MKKLILLSVLFTFNFLLSTLNCNAQWVWKPVCDTSNPWHAYIYGTVRVLHVDTLFSDTVYFNPPNDQGLIIGGEFDTLMIDSANIVRFNTQWSPFMAWSGDKFQMAYNGCISPISVPPSYAPPSVWTIAQAVWDPGSDSWLACGGKWTAMEDECPVYSTEAEAQNIAFWWSSQPDVFDYCYTPAFKAMDTVFAMAMLDENTIPNSCYPQIKTYVAARCVFCDGSTFTDSSKYIGMYNPCKGGTAIYAYHFMQGGTNGPVYAIEAQDTAHVYAGGRFDTAGTIKANNIAKWNSIGWDSLGSGTNGTIKVLLSFHGKLYAGGSFTMAGGLVANNIAVWDGSTWAALGTGTNGPVYAFTIFNGNLYAGGAFTMAGGHIVNNVAKWDGTNWSALSGGRNGDVYALASYKGDLYAGGKFKGGLYDTAKFLAKYTNPEYTGFAVISKPKTGITVYPIPAINNITIVAPQQAVIEISNIQGQLIKTLSTTSNKTNIDVSAFASGVYIVEVKTESGVGVRKFIKE